MLRISQLNLHPGHSPEELTDKICKSLRIRRADLLNYEIQKQSIDARKKPDIFFSYTVDVKVKDERQVLRKSRGRAAKTDRISYQLPSSGTVPLVYRPIIVGSGPAGLFCGYLLAKSGYAPVILERGNPVEERLKDVEEFWKTGNLNLSSNVQFGEGGAGTFSDGKLNTLVKDKKGRSRFVLQTFVDHGAPADILYEQKPHIGTDILTDIVKNMRHSIRNMGGEFRFQSQMTDIKMKNISRVDGKHDEIAKCIGSVVLDSGEEIDTNVCVLALGHSARDTFQMLYARQIPMEAKSFAVGVRIEHPQSMITRSQYGKTTYSGLPAASYKLTAKLKNKRGAYTFCMCPGGYVVNASSEEKRLAVNGMSYHQRDGINANSAVVVTVTPEDYKSTGPLSGIEFQRMLEECAYKEGKGRVPVQCFEDFRKNRPTVKLGNVVPQIKGDFTLANVRKIFPKELGDSLEEGILLMDDKIHGFAEADAVLSGVESRTSSPVKILRGPDFESTVSGLYPCGEGAGYAGGITSAAMDGIKTAEAIIKKYSQKLNITAPVHEF
ncbi:FAD dependent oxidoreductase [Clostridium sp. C105KSO13]|nr:NAD(P)-binding protein [Clostridium sp. C105KSO13]CUX50470.1 FAD dependent oxidoreductase [Clostridium sp. C105KSO13]